MPYTFSQGNTYLYIGFNFAEGKTKLTSPPLPFFFLIQRECQARNHGVGQPNFNAQEHDSVC